ncbi:MAG: tRNA 2-thiocytidine biosynthesis protein TtcA [Spirochaetaceae bacterium]|nr:MAG: tRNA 2-thiocytidine biosynthesis protein TtcA [Spirochaetaceae bacterium]
MAFHVRDLSKNEARKLEYFCKKVGRGINRFGMIHENEKILIGISGGKDSLALCYALAERMKWLPIKYDLVGLFIDWKEYPFALEKWKAMEEYCLALGIPVVKKSATMMPPSFKGRFDCYLCSRNKKRIFFDAANEMGITKIALGHHMDDIAETILMNMAFRGEFAAMMPVQEFFKGKIHMIRPMCEVRESAVAQAARILEVPAFSIQCPRKDKNRRIVMKQIIHTLTGINRTARENIYNSIFRINHEYLPKDNCCGLEITQEVE